jgi:hypothetical protein
MRSMRIITASSDGEQSAAADTAACRTLQHRALVVACLSVTLGTPASHLQRTSGAPLSTDSDV